MRHGQAYKLAWVDLSSWSVDYLEVDEGVLKAFIGGRGLGAAIIYKNLRSRDPLSRDSIICVMTSPLTGSGFPMANRLTFVFISPLTGTISWANTGGYASMALRNTGLGGLVITGASDKPVYLLVDESGVSVLDASWVWGLDSIRATAKLRHRHGDCRVVAIGPAGENLVRVATVINDTGRSSGVRHGLGCLFGSKRLKALVVRSRGPAARPMADKHAFRLAMLEASRKIRSSSLLNREKGLLAVYGTPVAVEALGADEAIPHLNYKLTRLEGYEVVGGSRMSDTILIGRLTCSYCPVNCRRETASAGRYRFRTEGPDYAQISSLGTNTGVLDLEVIAYETSLCYSLGLDPIEVGNTLAMVCELTENGLLKKGEGSSWGDAEKMTSLIWGMAFKKGLGGVMAMGCEEASRRLGGLDYSMSVKGITIQNTDPRVEPAWGLLNATENFGGAAHIWVYADLVYSMRHVGIKPLVRRDGRAREIALGVVWRQNLVALLDSLQVCAFSSYALTLNDYHRALEAVTGWGLKPEDLMEAGSRIFNLERLVNQRLGFSRESDRLPRRFTEEPVPTGVNKGRVCDLEELLEEYYDARGWGGGTAREWDGLSEVMSLL